MIGGGNKKGIKVEGFTIVELLIVIVVIAILAAIVTIAYNGVRDRALDSSVKSNAASVAKRISTYAIDNNDSYPTYMGFVHSLGLVDAASNMYRYTQTGGGTGYCLTVINGAKTYTASNTNPTPTAGRCAQHAQTAITNLAMNPSADSANTGFGSYGATGATTRQGSGSPSPQFGTAGIITGVYTGTGSGGLYFGTLAANRPDVTAGQPYTVSFYTRTNLSSPVTLYPYISWLNASAVQISTANGEPLVANNSEWKRATISGVAPVGAVKMIIYFGTTDSVWPGRQYLDGLMVTQGTEVYPYSDGDTSGWSWSGTAGLSTSSGLSL